MKFTSFLTTAIAMGVALATCQPASAELLTFTFDDGTKAITIDTVSITADGHFANVAVEGGEQLTFDCTNYDRQRRKVITGTIGDVSQVVCARVAADQILNRATNNSMLREQIIDGADPAAPR